MLHNRFQLRAVIVAAAIVLAACDMSGIPQVGRTYTGTGTIVYVDLLRQAEASVRMVVKQSGADVTISGSITARKHHGRHRRGEWHNRQDRVLRDNENQRD